MQLQLLLLLPTLALAYIQVDLRGEVQGIKLVSLEANPKGFVEREITKEEKTNFGVQDHHVKRAIEKINGKRPDEVYVTRDTPMENLHKKYGFEPVSVRVTPLRQDISFSLQDYLLSNKISETKYENANKQSQNILIHERGQPFTSIRTYTYWPSLYFRVHDFNTKITLSIKKDNDLIEFDNSFRIGESNLYVDDTYYEANATIRLEAGQKVTAELIAKKCDLYVQIPYEIRLTGDVVAKYTEMYKDKYFHKFDVSDILKAFNIDATDTIYQTLQYQAVFDAKIHIRDSNGTIISTIETKGNVATKGGGRKSSKKHEDKTGWVPMTNKKIEFKVPEDETIKTIGLHEVESEEHAEKQ